MPVSQCQALKNSSHHDNKTSLRFALMKDCKFLPIEVLSSVLESLTMPYTLTFHQTLGRVSGNGSTGLVGDVANNRSDIGAVVYTRTHRRQGFLDYSAMLGFGSPVSILSGKIFANTGNQFSVFNAFPPDLWIIFGITLIIVAIFEIFLHLKAKHSLLTFIIEILSNLFYFIIRFLNQNSNKYSRICCIKHLILNSTTFISISLLTLFFDSEILSNIVYNPLLNIESFDDIAEFLSKYPDVSLISDNESFTWRLMHDWQDDQVQHLFQQLQSVSTLDFDYEQVYRGKSIIIAFNNDFRIYG